MTNNTMTALKTAAHTALGTTTTQGVKALYPELDLRRKASWQHIIDDVANQSDYDRHSQELSLEMAYAEGIIESDEMSDYDRHSLELSLEMAYSEDLGDDVIRHYEALLGY